MKQMIAKNRKEAIAFVEGGNGHSQRAAYWLQGKIINRAEVIPGQKTATIKENVGGCWWDAKTTIAQKFGIDPVSTASAMGRKGGKATTDAKQASSRENGKLGGRPKIIKLYEIQVKSDGEYGPVKFPERENVFESRELAEIEMSAYKNRFPYRITARVSRIK